jgi:hypothetical protein
MATLISWQRCRILQCSLTESSVCSWKWKASISGNYSRPPSDEFCISIAAPRQKENTPPPPFNNALDLCLSGGAYFARKRSAAAAATAAVAAIIN